jgi:hypothetical protein
MNKFISMLKDPWSLPTEVPMTTNRNIATESIWHQNGSVGETYLPANIAAQRQ